MKRIAVLILLILSITTLRAQYIKDFSLDTALYIEEISAIFGNSLLDEEALVFESFIQTWDSLDFEKRQDIMEISDLMRQRSCRARPQFILFLSIMEEFHREDKYNFGYTEWVAGYRSFLESDKALLKEINKLQQLTYALLDQGLIYNSVSLSWQIAGNKYRFVFDDILKVEVQGADMHAFAGKDSIFIHEVEGFFDPFKQQFFGKEGKTYWDRAGFEREMVFATMHDYVIKVKEPGYVADSVIFTHSQLLKEPALGKLENRISQTRNPDQATYPRFNTYQNNFKLPDLVPGVNYRGALAMQGANLAGMESEGKLAVIDFFNDDTLRISINSKLFLFNASSIRSNTAEVSIYVEMDSIYHPDLILNYNIESERLRLTKSDDYNSQGPYSDSYHMIDMSFDELNWVRTESVIKMQAALATALGNALYESYDFFDLEFYSNLQGMEYQHPLADLWTFADMIGGNTFQLTAYAQYLRKDAYMVRHQLMQFSKQGFVYFDFENDIVTLRPKLYDYIDASLMQRDYDVIRFISRTDAGLENATLDLHTKDLTINGIPTIFLSDSQNVALVPENNQIVMKRNRDFQFSGVIDAGLFKFYGENFFFEYESFKINLQSIDSLSISAKTGERDAYGNPLTTTLDNKIENITGELLIDAPFNKSGLQNFPDYPIFTSRENSYVYFDEAEVQDGVYDRNRFYFELYPFSIDSLDNFTREAMKMEGTFISADILPPLDMEMSLRPDNSLGFYMTTPEEGIPIFGGKATFYNDIEMSTAGLHGYGSLDYITSTTWSDDFLFHPDSIMTTSRRFLEREKGPDVSFPYVENEIAQVRYYPFEDVMNINRIESVFRIFSDSVKFGGDLALRPTGLTGNGGLAFPDARLESDEFSFQAQRVLADSVGVRFRKPETEDFTFNTNDVRLDLDLVARKGDIVARGDFAQIEMPANLYETRLDQVTWFMDRDEVMMTQTKYLAENQIDIGIDSLKVNGPTYVSKHPKQDSLYFTAPVAYFNYSAKRLQADQVPFIEVGDSYIFPSGGDVEILNEAKMTTLRDAKILANTSERYHDLYNGVLTIDSRLHYRGSADYDYIDEFGNVYTAHMTDVEVDTSLETFAKGEIFVQDSFKLSPFFDYQGLVSMRATHPLLNFAGGVRLTHDCEINKQWLKFETEIDPDSVVIPVEEKMQNIGLNRIYAGTLIARDSTHIYPTLFSGRKDYFDRNITYSNGVLYYNKALQSYEFGSLAKLSDKDAEGNYLALRTDSCELYSEGRINLQLDYGRVKLKAFGYASHDVPKNSLDLKLMLGMDFLFSPEALSIFGNEVDSVANLEPVNITTRFYELGMKNMLGTKDAERLETELGLYGNYVELPDSMKQAIFFNDIELKWNQETRSFRYTGKVGIGTIGDVQINKKVDAYIEFVEKGSGDVFDIYLMIDENTWYYLAYSPGGLQVLSSNADFNQILLDLPAKERTIKGRGRQSAYIYSVASNRRLSLFLDRYLMYEESLQEQSDID